MEAPVDSIREKNKFIIGVSSLEEIDQSIREKSDDKYKFLGSWHTHPNSPPHESDRDKMASQEAIKKSLGINPFYLSIIFSVDTSDSSVINHKCFLRTYSNYE